MFSLWENSPSIEERENVEKTEEESKETDGERERWRELGSARKNEIVRGKFQGRSRERER